MFDSTDPFSAYPCAEHSRSACLSVSDTQRCDCACVLLAPSDRGGEPQVPAACRAYAVLRCFCLTRMIAAHQVIRVRAGLSSARFLRSRSLRVSRCGIARSPHATELPHPAVVEQVRGGRRGPRQQRARLASQKPLPIQLEWSCCWPIQRWLLCRSDSQQTFSKHMVVIEFGIASC